MCKDLYNKINELYMVKGWTHIYKIIFIEISKASKKTAAVTCGVINARTEHKAPKIW